ncbi:hypothetical protein DL768_011157 [Monosporascus sp. mg162]|nr:hypothetical protein DL768_011157 [Monosporascus sp. mg162]
MPTDCKCPRRPSGPSTDVSTIDADGDLHLIVGENKYDFHTRLRMPDDWEHHPHHHKESITFVVDSRALSRSSPVFKRMLYGCFAESKRPTDGQWIVHLPEDDPHPMETILHIIHGNFAKAQTNLQRHFPSNALLPKFEPWRIYDVTVLTDKYNLTHLLVPWVPHLIPAIEASVKEYRNRSNGQELSRFMWVMWELGHKEAFKLLVGAMMRQSTIDKYGNLRDAEHRGRWFKGVLEPGKIIDFIRTKRLLHIGDILLKFHEVNQLCSHRARHARLDTQKELAKLSLWPIPEREKYSGSINNLSGNFGKFFRVVCDVHFDCDVECAIRSRMLGTLRWNQNPRCIRNLPDWAVNHLDTQAKKSGIAALNSMDLGASNRGGQLRINYRFLA